MTHHVLACALYCNPDGSPNGLGTAWEWFIGLPLGLAAVIGFIRFVAGQLGVKSVRNDPVTSPWVREVVTGYRTPAYTAPVRAVTPSGTLVRQARCCLAGHQVPEQAVAHAAAVGARIGRTGR